MSSSVSPDTDIRALVERFQSENVRLAARVEELERDYLPLATANSRLVAERDALRQRVERMEGLQGYGDLVDECDALRADKERLDYVASKCSFQGDRELWWSFQPEDWEGDNDADCVIQCNGGQDLRAAIDAARAKEQKP